VEEKKLILIEDCAHALGASWRGRPLGTFGVASAWSCQTNKLINAGEGGFLTSTNVELIGRATVHSGSYGYYKAHRLFQERPDLDWESIFESSPNCSMRMATIPAVLIKHALRNLDARIERYRTRYEMMEAALLQDGPLDGVVFGVVQRDPRETQFVAQSIQFQVYMNGLGDLDRDLLEDLHSSLLARNVQHAWYGRTNVLGFTATYRFWGKVCGSQRLPQSESMMRGLFDIPLSHSESWEDSDFLLLAEIIREEVANIGKKVSAALISNQEDEYERQKQQQEEMDARGVAITA
jgi:dTDP-4-amino-4,6-dideoxygalactose transaminase